MPCFSIAKVLAATPARVNVSPLAKKLSYYASDRPFAFHQSLPGYAATPLVSLKDLASQDGLGGIFVKDESKRFGLNAFKCLGSSFAVAAYIARLVGLESLLGTAHGLDFSTLIRFADKKVLGELTFMTATDGNHGRGLAWAARMLGHKAVVIVPKGTVQARIDNIRKEGAEVLVTDLTYDECVQLAADRATRENCVLVQDTSFEGYEEIPLRIMQGYTTIVHELVSQADASFEPTHVFLQAGVGSFAAAIAASLLSLWPRITIVIVEPASADCLYRTAREGKTTLQKVDTPMTSMMAGLCCGTPSTQAWDILRRCASFYLTCEDDAYACGMRVYAHPVGNDTAIESGESGAVTLGVLHGLMQDDDKVELRKVLGLGSRSQVLLFNTEGATDPENYRKVLSMEQ